MSDEASESEQPLQTPQSISDETPAPSAEVTAADVLAEVRDELSRGEMKAASDALSEALVAFPELDDDPHTHLLIGRCAHEMECFRNARQHYRFAAQSEECRIEALYRLGRSWLDSGRFERAVFPLLKVAHHPKAHVPFRVHANSGLAVAFAGIERFQAAQQAIERAASPGLISGQLLADEAFRLTTVGGTEEAQGQLTRALQIDAECVDAHVLLANLLLIDGRGYDALDVLVTGLHHAPQSLKLFSMLGEVHYSLGEHREAAGVFQRCLELSPHGANADATRMSFARCFYHAGRPTQTKVELELLLKLHPGSNFTEEAKSRIASLEAGNKGGYRIGDFPRALQRRNYCAPNTVANVLRFFGFDASQDDVAERVLTNGTRWNDLISYLDNLEGVKVFAFLSDQQQVRELLEQDIPVIVGEYEGMEGHCIALTGYDTWAGVYYAQDPNFFDPVEITFDDFEKSWRYTDQLAVVVVPDDNDDARTAFVESIEQRGSEQVSRWLHALRLQAESDNADAIAEFEALAEAYPDYLSAYRTLVETRIASRDFVGAKELLAELRERFSENTPYWVLRFSGDVTLRLGDPDEAISFYKAARKVYDGDPILHYVQAEIAFALEQRRRGRAELVRSLELNPTMVSSRIRMARECFDSEEFRYAKYHAESALEIAPDSAKARDILEAAKARIAESDDEGEGEIPDELPVRPTPEEVAESDSRPTEIRTKDDGPDFSQVEEDYHPPEHESGTAKLELELVEIDEVSDPALDTDTDETDEGEQD